MIWWADYSRPWLAGYISSLLSFLGSLLHNPAAANYEFSILTGALPQQHLSLPRLNNTPVARGASHHWWLQTSSQSQGAPYRHLLPTSEWGLEINLCHALSWDHPAWPFWTLTVCNALSAELLWPLWGRGISLSTFLLQESPGYSVFFLSCSKHSPACMPNICLT